LDVAGGYGLLTRLMRDVGFDFFWSDKYCKNLFARGFEGATDKEFTAVTAFEVMEHLHDPLNFITEALSNAKTQTIIFTTELFTKKPPNPNDWWYYTFETGQHISFYQKKTLQVMSDKLGLNFYSSGGIHIFTDKKINPLEYRLLTSSKISYILSLISNRSMTSRMMSDHLYVMGRDK
jgi:hypothetical protein